MPMSPDDLSTEPTRPAKDELPPDSSDTPRRRPYVKPTITEISKITKLSQSGPTAAPGEIPARSFLRS